MSKPTKFLPDSKVRKRYGVCSMSIRRWERDLELGFPRAIVIRRRKFRAEAELDEFDARQRAKSSGAA